VSAWLQYGIEGAGNLHDHFEFVGETKPKRKAVRIATLAC
jgi:hypothetical protein